MRIIRVCLPGLALIGALMLGGCAGLAIKQVELAAPIDAAPLARELEAYNSTPAVVKVVGRVTLDRVGTLDYGARVESGRGARVDAVTGAMARLVFSAGCVAGERCEFYLPSQNTLYRTAGGWPGIWLSSIMAGRVPVVGEPVEAWTDIEGRRVLRLTDERGNWQLVVFPADQPWPSAAQYGREGERASLEIALAAFFEQDGLAFPGRIEFAGEDSREVVVFEPSRIVTDAEPGRRGFSLTPPKGVELVEDGDKIWRRLGLLWTP